MCFQNWYGNYVLMLVKFFFSQYQTNKVFKVLYFWDCTRYQIIKFPKDYGDSLFGINLDIFSSYLIPVYQVVFLMILPIMCKGQFSNNYFL
jgi:hypothetical protein